MPELQTRASCRKDWKKISAESSLTFPPTTLSVKGLNWTELRGYSKEEEGGGNQNLVGWGDIKMFVYECWLLICCDTHFNQFEPGVVGFFFFTGGSFNTGRWKRGAWRAVTQNARNLTKECMSSRLKAEPTLTYRVFGGLTAVAGKRRTFENDNTVSTRLSR